MKKLFIILTAAVMPFLNTSFVEAEASLASLELTGPNVEIISVLSQSEPYPISIRDEVKGNNLYVECVISNFTLAKRDEKVPNKKGTGYIQLYLNNQKIDDIYTAAFIVKGLPKGTHKIKLELVHNDGTPYGIEKEFEATISG